MKKFMGAAMLAGAALAGTTGVANAEGSFSGSVTMASDYVFRGITQTDSSAAIQGSLDYTNGIFYAGLWGSNVDFTQYSGYTGSMELDAYVGITPTTGPVAWDLAVIGYFYPGSDESDNLDYYEVKVAPSINITEAFSVGAAVFYSPEFFAESGEAWYYEVNAGYALSDALSLSATYGTQDVESYGDSYDVYTLGATYSLAGFDLGLTYSDTDGAEDVYGPGSYVDGTFTFSIGRSL